MMVLDGVVSKLSTIIVSMKKGEFVCQEEEKKT